MGIKTPDSLNCFRDIIEDVRCIMEEGIKSYWAIVQLF